MEDPDSNSTLIMLVLQELMALNKKHKEFVLAISKVHSF